MRNDANPTEFCDFVSDFEVAAEVGSAKRQRTCAACLRGSTATL
jgi:hypothetical protein